MHSVEQSLSDSTWVHFTSSYLLEDDGQLRLVGVDIGGTFTDLVLYDENKGVMEVAKLLSRRGEETEVVLDALNGLNLEIASIDRITHGTTVGTNTLLEKTGARIALLTTAGFRDVLEIGRTQRLVPQSLFNSKFVRPRPLVPRSRRLEVKERILADGSVQQPVCAEEISNFVGRLKEMEIEAVAVCYLNSYANGGNERRTAELLFQAMPELYVSLSHQVVPEYKEFERFSTAVTNSYLGPKIREYVAALEDRLKDVGYRGSLFVMASNGGMIDAERAAAFPVQTILSGPAGGVVGSVALARELGLDHLITCDMGGTSTDVCLVRNGQPVVARDNTVGHLPLKTSQLQINTVGAGGGSIAWKDEDGALHVGPKSAGSKPGPACYGLGGSEPTVTDANLVLSRLSRSTLLAGKILLQPVLAEKSLATLAESVGIGSAAAMARGIIDIAVAKMVSSIREISVERGFDPREHTLVAYGGAGPLHAALIAARLSMERIVVPIFPGNFSAVGLLMADPTFDSVRTHFVRMDDACAYALDAVFEEIASAPAAQLRNAGFEKERRFRSVDIRYVGQAFELTIPAGEGPGWLERLAIDFHRHYKARYGHCHSDEPIEIAHLRIRVTGEVEKPRWLRHPEVERTLGGALIEERDVYFREQISACPIYARDQLPSGQRFSGPAVIEEYGSATLVPPEWEASQDSKGHLHLIRAEA